MDQIKEDYTLDFIKYTFLFDLGLWVCSLQIKMPNTPLVPEKGAI